LPASTAARLLDVQAVPRSDGAREPEAMIDDVARSGLRGRGGAGYPLADKLRAVRTNGAGGATYVVANAYDADPDSPLSRTLLERNASLVLEGIRIAARVVGAAKSYLYLHPEANAARRAAKAELGGAGDIEIALGPGGFMGGEESALLAVLESRRAMARQRPPYPAAQGLMLRPTLVSSAETLAWLPLIVGADASPDTKLVSVTGAVKRPGVYEVAFGTTLGAIFDLAGGTVGALKGIHVGGPTGGILAARRTDVRLGFDELRSAGTHLGSAQVRAIAADACIVREAGKLFAYLARESCAICVPCRVGTKRVQGILEGVSSGLGRADDLPWLEELGAHLRDFSLCGFGITSASIIRTTLAEFPDDYRAHIDEGRCPTGTCAPVRARRFETMAQL